jgi:hypothetical protein
MSGRDTAREVSQENVEIVRRAFTAVNQRPKPDFATVNVLHDPDHEFISATTGVEGRSFPGRAPSVNGWRTWATLGGVGSGDRQRAGIDEDRVLSVWTFSAHNKHGASSRAARG